MRARHCKFCHGEGHNIRSCKEAKKAKANIAEFGDIVYSEAPKAVVKDVPYSSFGGSMLNFRFNLESYEEPFSAYGAGFRVPYGTDYGMRSVISNVVYEKLSERNWDVEYGLQKSLFIKIDDTTCQEVSFLACEDSFDNYNNGRDTFMMMSKRINFNSEKYIQGKLNEEGDNVFKKILSEIKHSHGLEKYYTDYEGKESLIVAGFMKEVMQKMLSSGNNKESYSSRLFDAIATSLSQEPRKYDLGAIFNLKGEFFNVSSPEMRFFWDWSNSGLGNNPALESIRSDQNLLKEIEERVEKYLKNQLFIHARECIHRTGWREMSTGLEEPGLIPFSAIRDLQAEGLEGTILKTEGSYVYSSGVYQGGLISSNEPSKEVLAAIERSCNLRMGAAENGMKDFVKMAHTGGTYRQTFNKGKLLRGAVDTIYVPQDAGIKCATDRFYHIKNGGIVRGIERDWSTYHEPALTLSDLLNAALETLCNAERKIL